MAISARRESFLAVLRAYDCDPVRDIIREIQTRVPVNAEELSEPHITSALNDYELIREHGQYFLKLRASLRIKLLMGLLEYTVPKVRADELPPLQQVNVTIVRFSDREPAVKLEPPVAIEAETTRT